MRARFHASYVRGGGSSSPLGIPVSSWSDSCRSIRSLPICHLKLGASKPKSCEYPNELTTIGDHLLRRRLDLGLRQGDVAQIIGANVQSIWFWEKNRAYPEVKWWPRILGFLGYNPRPKPQTVGERLVSYREGLGWSQKRLAEALNVDPTTLSRW